MGHPVCLGDVFIKTHTKADGSFVDKKAEMVAKKYQENVLLKLSELEAESSAVSDGTSRTRELTPEEYTTIFLEVMFHFSQYFCWVESFFYFNLISGSLLLCSPP